ncbi:MAG: bifunctional phosphoglucose/phosphomannose isomerase [candidate division Zixibacteria bacterium]|nr:bifunctional phosphoglucose/phosphomannose isomerase [candidate division Zixibacteria bacterium]
MSRDLTRKILQRFEIMETKLNLDKLEDIKKIDRQGMYDLIYNFPPQLTEGAHLGFIVDLNLENFIPDNIILTGMGGSAMGGDLARSFLASELRIPFWVCRSYNLPEFVNNKSLVFVSSYSGNTEETLSAYQEAKRRKAKIIAITSGGKLLEECKRNNFPFILIPKGLPPRAALGYSLTPILVTLSRLGLVSDKIEELENTSKFLEKKREEYSLERRTKENPAKTLALNFFQKIPIIYSSTDYFDAVGYRWKGQFCENSKILAFNNYFPEFNHNELVGGKVLDQIRDRLVVIILQDKEDHPRIHRRMQIVKEIIEREKVKVIEIKSEGENLLSRIFSLIQLGDFTSFYLAILNEVDPTPVKVIDYLKNKLAT